MPQDNTQNIPLTREEQLELENANLKIALAQQQLQQLTLLRNDVLAQIGRAHDLKEGNFSIDAAAGVIRPAPAPVAPVQDLQGADLKPVENEAG